MGIVTRSDDCFAITVTITLPPRLIKNMWDSLPGRLLTLENPSNLSMSDSDFKEPLSRGAGQGLRPVFKGTSAHGSHSVLIYLALGPLNIWREVSTLIGIVFIQLVPILLLVEGDEQCSSRLG